MMILRPFGRLLKTIDLKAYTSVRWRMRTLMGNPMSQLFLLPFLVRKGDTVIDIGANTGQFVLPLARLVGSRGFVYAFEPITKTFSELKKNVESESLGSRVILNQLGLSDSPQYATFIIPKERYTEATLRPHNSEDWTDYENKKENYFTERCEITTLDKHVRDNKIDGISFMKCDVEGGELQAFKGAVETLKSSRPILMFETYESWTKDFGYHPRDLFQFLENEAGYNCYWLWEKGLKRVNSTDETIPGIFYQWIDFLCVIPEVHGKRINVETFLA